MRPRIVVTTAQASATPRLVPSAAHAARLSKNASYHRRLQPSIGSDVSDAELKDTMISETIGRNRKT